MAKVKKEINQSNQSNQSNQPYKSNQYLKNIMVTSKYTNITNKLKSIFILSLCFSLYISL